MRSAPAGDADWTAASGDIAADYDHFVERLSCSAQAKRLRRQAAGQFLRLWPDPEAWMRRPTPARLRDLAHTGAWPLLSWAFVTGVVVPDVDLLGGSLQGVALRHTWAACYGDDVAAATGGASELGWAATWAHQVCESMLAFVCMTSKSRLADLDAEVLGWVATELDAAPSISASRRKVLQSRLGGLRQVCFQLGLLAEPPPHPNRRRASPADQVAGVPQREIREVARRYVATVAATLRPSTVEGRADTLVAFGVWLAEHHPNIAAWPSSTARSSRSS